MTEVKSLGTEAKSFSITVNQPLLRALMTCLNNIVASYGIEQRWALKLATDYTNKVTELDEVLQKEHEELVSKSEDPDSVPYPEVKMDIDVPVDHCPLLIQSINETCKGVSKRGLNIEFQNDLLNLYDIIEEGYTPFKPKKTVVDKKRK